MCALQGTCYTKTNDNPYVLPSSCHNSHLPMANAPAVKPWGLDDKDKLQKLIDNGKVDISKTNNIDYINSIRHKYFRECDNGNFHHKFLTLASLK